MGGLKTTYRISILGGHHIYIHMYIYIYTYFFPGGPRLEHLKGDVLVAMNGPAEAVLSCPEMYVRMHACMHVCTHACACMRACVRACVRACGWKCVCVCVTCSRRSPLPKAQYLLSHIVSCIYVRLIMTGDPLSVYIIYFSMAENHLEHLYGPHRDVLSVELLDVLGETLWSYGCTRRNDSRSKLQPICSKWCSQWLSVTIDYRYQTRS